MTCIVGSVLSASPTSTRWQAGAARTPPRTSGPYRWAGRGPGRFLTRCSQRGTTTCSRPCSVPHKGREGRREMREVKAASGPNAVQHHPPFGMPPLDVRATSMFIQPRKRPLAPHETAHRLCLQPPSVGPAHTVQYRIVPSPSRCRDMRYQGCATISKGPGNSGFPRLCAPDSHESPITTTVHEGPSQWGSQWSVDPRVPCPPKPGPLPFASKIGWQTVDHDTAGTLAAGLALIGSEKPYHRDNGTDRYTGHSPVRCLSIRHLTILSFGDSAYYDGFRLLPWAVVPHLGCLLSLAATQQRPEGWL